MKGELNLKIMFIVAITAVIRKIIITDFKTVDAFFVMGIAPLIAALSLGYFSLIRERSER